MSLLILMDYELCIDKGTNSWNLVMKVTLD